MAIYDLVQAQQYNDIRKTVRSVLESGNGEYGYGQAMTSYDVKADTIIMQEHFDNLRQDLNKCNRHQTGLNFTEIQLPVIEVRDTIEWANFVSLQLAASQILAAKDTIYEGSTVGSYTQQSSIVAGGYRRLSSGWGVNSSGQRYGQQVYEVTWSTANAARYFFNSGGYLQTVMYTEGTATNTKSSGWVNIITLLNEAACTFGASEYRQGISGTTTSFSTKLNDTTNPYYENYGVVRFTLLNPKKVQVLVQFVDNDSGDHNPSSDHGDPAYWGVAVDEPVTIDILSGLEYRKPIDAVVVETPSFTVAGFTLPYDQVTRAYSTPGPHSMVVPPGTTSLSVLLVGGGGGGAFPGIDFGNDYYGGGGGGCGEVLIFSFPVTPLETINITVGAGGLGGAVASDSTAAGRNGNDSSITGPTGGIRIARGGKGGVGQVGGKSGGGMAGGFLQPGQTAGTGGGGYITPGNSYNGGAGTTYNIGNGTYNIGGGGGGGNSYDSSPPGLGIGGQGGGGNGASSITTYLAGDGEDGTGGGGGGSGEYITGFLVDMLSLPGASRTNVGGRGGNGIVVIYG